VEQNRGPRYKSTQLCPTYFDKGTKTYNGKNIASSTNGAGKSGYLPAEN
jgi:hypothetical protein